MRHSHFSTTTYNNFAAFNSGTTNFREISKEAF